jgi:hypothetical protein
MFKKHAKDSHANYKIFTKARKLKSEEISRKNEPSLKLK